jgi:competence protein ComGC
MVVNDLDWHPKLAVGTLGLVNALSSFMSLLCAFFYLPLVYAIGVSYTFYIFAAIALICVVLLAVLLPGKKKKKKAVALDPTENVANVVESEKQKEMPDHEQPATKEVDQDQQVMQEKELEETKVAADTENTNEYDF